MMGSFATDDLGPQRKLASIVGLTGELAHYSAEDATTILDFCIREAAGMALDSAVFSTAAANDVRPAGLLAGVPPISAKTSGGDAAMTADLSNLAGAISDAGGGAGILYFANPRQETAIRLRSPTFATSVVPTPRLPAGTVVAIEAGAIASGFDEVPRVDIANTPVIHWDDAPAQVSTPGSPATVAAPVRSGYQQDMLALRLILRCAWASRMPGAVQVVTGVTW